MFRMRIVRQVVSAAFNDIARAGTARFLVVGGILIVGTAVALATIALLGATRHAAIAGAEHELRNLAIVLAKEVEREFQAVELVEAGLADHMRETGITTENAFRLRMGTQAVQQNLKDRIAGLPHVSALALDSAHGRLFNFSRFWPPPEIDITERDYYRALSGPSPPPFFISEPTLSKSTGAWSLYLTRRYDAPDGTLLGILTGVMQPNYNERIFSQLSLGNSGTFSVVRDDGLVLARYPNINGAIGQKLAPERVRMLHDAARNQTVVRLVSVLDHGERLFAVETLTRYPLCITVSNTVDDVLSVSRGQARSLIAGTTLIEAMLFGLMLLSFRHIRGQKALASATVAKLEAEAAHAGAQAELGLAREREIGARQLQVQHRRFELALNNMTQGLCMFDDDGQLMVANRTFLDLFRLDAGMLPPGAGIDEVLRETRKSVIMSEADVSALALQLSGRSLDGANGSFTWQLTDGRTFIVGQQAVAGIGWLATYADTSALVRAEDESRAKSTFLAIMSHELRTPMNGVLGLLSTLRETHLSRDQQETLDLIHKSGEELMRILNDILDLSKLNAGKMTFRSEPFAPASVTDDVVALVRPLAEAKGLTIRADLPDPFPLGCLGDGGRLRQVLLNLLSNAIKFTDTGHVFVEWRVIGQTNDHVCMEWKVHDTGIGIRPERIDSVFDEFTQVDDSISRRIGGTGLGLPICRRLIDQMGGTLDIDSEPGRGSCCLVRLTLPITAPPVAREPNDEKVNDRLRSWVKTLGREPRILLAEDNRTNQILVRRMLQGLPIKLEVVDNGRAAVEATSRMRPDLICMDMQMPEMDGLEATRRIRASSGESRSVPIVAITANAFPDDVRNCHEAGMTGFLPKPLNKQMLLRAILDGISGKLEHPALSHT